MDSRTQILVSAASARMSWSPRELFADAALGPGQQWHHHDGGGEQHESDEGSVGFLAADQAAALRSSAPGRAVRSRSAGVGATTVASDRAAE